MRNQWARSGLLCLTAMSASASFAFSYRFDVQVVSTATASQATSAGSGQMNNLGQVVYSIGSQYRYWNGSTTASLPLTYSFLQGFNDSGDFIGVRTYALNDHTEVHRYSVADLGASPSLIHAFYFSGVDDWGTSISNFTQSGRMGINDSWFRWGHGNSTSYNQAHVYSPNWGSVAGMNMVRSVSEDGTSIQYQLGTEMTGRVVGGNWTPLPGCQTGIYANDGTEYLFYSDHILRTDSLGVETTLPVYSITKVNNAGWGIGTNTLTSINENFTGNIDSLLTGSSSGFSITRLMDINESGQILAVGARNGQFSLVRLNPTLVPEPATLLGLLPAGLLLARRRTRK